MVLTVCVAVAARISCHKANEADWACDNASVNDEDQTLESRPVECSLRTGLMISLEQLSKLPAKRICSPYELSAFGRKAAFRCSAVRFFVVLSFIALTKKPRQSGAFV